MVTEAGVDKGFAEAMRKDWAAWRDKQAKEKGDVDWKLVFSRKNPIATLNAIGKDLGVGNYNPTEDLAAAKRMSRIADTISGLSGGEYGSGHSYSYMTHGNHSSMEVFAHAFSAIVQGDKAFEKLFGNVIDAVRKGLKL
jgi:hypothetical protein